MLSSSSSPPLRTPSVPVSKMRQAPLVELLDLFVISVIKEALLTLTDVDSEKEEALHESAFTNYWSLHPLLGSKEKLRKRTSVLQKFAIVESEKLL